MGKIYGEYLWGKFMGKLMEKINGEILWEKLYTPSPRVTRILVPGKDRVMRKPC